MIDKFYGKYRFLSNFWPVDIMYQGVVLPSVEHAYVAAKGGIDTKNYLESLLLYSPAQVKKHGRIVAMRKGWDSIKYDYMLDFTRQKYSHPHLAELLLSTGEQPLVEGNTWGDTYWGVCKGVGQNNLGKILMKVRDEIGRET